MKRIEKDTELLRKISSGSSKLAAAVGSTLGPRGRTVALSPSGGPVILTKDGVTVAKFFELEDPFENLGVHILKQASIETCSIAGDGTTTSTILANSIVQSCSKFLASGISAMALKRGVDMAVEEIVSELDNMARPICSFEEIEAIATISANGDKTVGALVAEAVDSVGKDGSISIEESKSRDTVLDLVEGFRIAGGYYSSSFVTDKRLNLVKYSNPLVLVTDHRIDSVEQILPILQFVAREGRPLIIVAEELENQALAACIMNSIKGTMKVAAIKPPGYGEERKETLRDLAVALGARFVSVELGDKLEEAKLIDLGEAKKVEVGPHSSTFIGGLGRLDEVSEHIESLRGLLAAAPDLVLAERVQERISRMASAVAIIRVGGMTDVEVTERKHRIEDALEAVRSSLEEGIVIGGGMALVYASEALQKLSRTLMGTDEEYGVRIIREALLAPFETLSSSADLSAEVLLSKLALSGKNKNINKGYDFHNLYYADLVAKGVVDPVKVTKRALLNAASAASLVITTSYAIIEE